MTRSTRRHVALAAAIMSLSAIASRVLGFLREVILAAQLGASGETDAYFAAFSLPDLLKYLLEGGALSFAFVPIFAEFLAKDREDAAWRLFSNIATHMVLALSALIALGYVFTPWAVQTLNPGFGPDQVADTVRLTRIILPQPLLMTLGGLIIGTEAARKRFLASAVQPVIYNACIIIGGLALTPTLGAAGFSWGVLVGALLGSVVTPLYLARDRIQYRFRLATFDPDLRRYVLLALPLMFGVSLAMVDEWIARYFASSLEPGSITWLNNARRLVQVPTGLIGQAIGYAALPFLSALVGEGKLGEVSKTLKASLRGGATLATVAAIGVAVFAQPVVSLAFERGAFDHHDAAMTAEMLLIFSAGVLSWSVYAVATRAFYARSNTWTPMLTSTAVALVSLPIYAALTSRFLIRGIAWGGVIGMTLNVTAMLAVYWWRYRDNLFGATAMGVWRGAEGGIAGLAVVLGLNAALDGVALMGTLVWTALTGSAFLVVSLAVLLARGGEAADAIKAKLTRVARRLRRR